MEKLLSASKAGFPCMRNLWYTVNGHRGTGELDKKTQRIFDVGTCLEPLIVEWLRADGWDVEYNPGSQEAELKVEIPVLGGKLVGHPDCIISKGEVQNALVDIKTMNDRAFRYWKRDGTEKTKPQYVTQLHIYATGLKAQGRNIEKLGIVGVNKNNSEMYIDFFDFDPFRETAIKDYTEMLFKQSEAPELGCPTESWACSYCEYSESCEVNKEPDVASTQEGSLTVTEDEDLEKQAKKAIDEKVKAKGLSGVIGGGLVLRMKEKNSSKFDEKAFKEAHPEMVSQYTHNNVSIVYDLKELKP